MILNGYVDVSGSANIMDYVFQNGNVIFEFGDPFCEDGKELLIIKLNGKEFKHEIKSCYWLDLIM